MKYNMIKTPVYFAFLCLPLLAFAQTDSPEDDIPVLETESPAEEDAPVQVAYRKVSAEDLLGGVSYINVGELMKKSYMTSSLSDMQALVGGWNGNSLWAQESYLVLVDGVARDANNVMPSEIEQITFLKGASAVVLYGSRAAKGVVYITTKRGKEGHNRIDVRGNTGFYVPISYPKYLGSAEYMTLYNEARANDGLDASYSDSEIYHYASGSNPYRYPSLNLYSSDYLKKAYNQSDATAEISGGTEKARFYANVNFYNIGSLLKYGDAGKDHTTRLSVRGNIDMKISNYISAFADANATFYDSRSASGDFWNAAATLRPNRISPLIPTSYISQDNDDLWSIVNASNHLIDGKYLLGGTQLDQTNALADLYASGYGTYTSRQYQFDMGVNYDMSAVLKGLSFKALFAIDYATSYNKYYSNSYATYEASWSNTGDGDEIIGLTKYGEDSKSGVENVSGSYSAQTMTFSAQFDYNRCFNKSHNLQAMLVASGWQQSASGEYHRTSNVNLSFEVDYNYLGKYYLTSGNAVVHSARLPKGNRDAFSPSVTAGWRLGKEDWFKNSVVDDWVLTASASILNTDLDISDYYMYDETWTYSDAAWIGWADSNLSHAFESRRGENDDMTFIKRKEISVGTKGSLFGGGLKFDINYFLDRQQGNLVQASTLYPNYFSTGWPVSSFIPYVNYNNYNRTGFEFSIEGNRKIGQADVTLGVTGTYYTTKNARLDETYENDYQYREGKPIDGVWGLQTAGFFNSQEEVDNWATSEFGEVQPGDLKYIDQNGDGVINSDDVVYLGKRYGWYGSPFTLGVNLTLKWKDFTLFLLGTGYFGGTGVKDSSYYWVYGDRKYSEVVLGRWTEETKETATYPRLTTLSNTHNFQTSDFWLYSTSRFNLSKVQLTYDLPARWFAGTVIKGLSVYAYATNLFTIAKERKTLELTTAAAPQTRFYNVGFKIGF